MSVKWYYRQSEVPDSVYQHLVQDRNNENGKASWFTCPLEKKTHTHTCRGTDMQTRLLGVMKGNCALYFKG